MPNPFLEKIVKAKREELAGLKYRTSLADLRSRCRDLEPPRLFRQAILRPPQGPLRLIAEIKKASPSKGLLMPNFDPRGLAETYEKHGAAALSVLTERFFFLGSPEHIEQVKASVSLPVLRKDFLLTDYHIYEGRCLGADAVLLITRILEPSLLSDLIHLASGLGMTPLVEVHTLEELAVAVTAGARILGVNNRNLETFEVSLETTLSLLTEIPKGTVIVSESGYASPANVEKVRPTRVDALLIGEAFVTSQDIPGKLNELQEAMGIPTEKDDVY